MYPTVLNGLPPDQRAFAYHEPATGDFVIIDDCGLVPCFNYPQTPRAGQLHRKFNQKDHLFVLYRPTGMYSLLLGAPQQLERTVPAGVGASRRVNLLGRCASNTFYYNHASGDGTASSRLGAWLAEEEELLAAWSASELAAIAKGLSATLATARDAASASLERAEAASAEGVSSGQHALSSLWHGAVSSLLHAMPLHHHAPPAAQTH